MKTILVLAAAMLFATSAQAGEELCMDTTGLPPTCQAFLDTECAFYTQEVDYCLTLSYPANVNCIVDAAQNYQDNVNSLLQMSFCQPQPEPHPGDDERTASAAIMFARVANLQDPTMFRGIDLWRF